MCYGKDCRMFWLYQLQHILLCTHKHSNLVSQSQHATEPSRKALLDENKSVVKDFLAITLLPLYGHMLLQFFKLICLVFWVGDQSRGILQGTQLPKKMITQAFEKLELHLIVTSGLLLVLQKGTQKQKLGHRAATLLLLCAMCASVRCQPTYLTNGEWRCSKEGIPCLQFAE